MKILLISHSPLESNSGYHVANFSSELIKLGHELSVAVPKVCFNFHKSKSQHTFNIISYRDVINSKFSFSDNSLPDLIHCWTPREIIRKLVNKIYKKVNIPYIIHFEDNEKLIFERYAGMDWDEYKVTVRKKKASLIPGHICNPHAYNDFLRGSIGATVIINTLRKLIPFNIPTIELFPGSNGRHMCPSKRKELRSLLNISEDTTVIVYNGNVHSAIQAEIYSLYLSICILARSGYNIRLVRTGINHEPLYDEAIMPFRKYFIELGYCPYAEIPGWLSIADLFVQPGLPGEFNDFRVPSKLPEFFDFGKPVILPKTNIGLITKHKEDAYVLEEANATSIANAIIELIEDCDLYQNLACNAKRFGEKYFSWSSSTMILEEFYLKILDENNQIS